MLPLPTRPDPTRRELMADVEELPLHVRLNRFKQACQVGHMIQG